MCLVEFKTFPSYFWQNGVVKRGLFFYAIHIVSFLLYFCRDSIRKQHSAFFSHKQEGDFSEEGVHEGKKIVVIMKIKTGLSILQKFN